MLFHVELHPVATFGASSQSQPSGLPTSARLNFDVLGSSRRFWCLPQRKPGERARCQGRRKRASPAMVASYVRISKSSAEGCSCL